jgi:hypothetical protein
MTTPPGLPARALIAAADEALTEASFLTADFAAAERLFTEARDLATQHGDREGEALLPWRIRDAEQNLAKAEAAVRAAG